MSRRPHGIGRERSDGCRNAEAVVDRIDGGPPRRDRAGGQSPTEGRHGPQRVIGKVGEFREIRVEAAEPERRGGPGPAGVFPLRFGGQRAVLAGLRGEPAAKCIRLIPGNPDDRLLGAVGRIAAFGFAELEEIAAFDPAVVRGIEAGVLFVGDFAAADPERFGDGDTRRRPACRRIRP